MMRLLNSSRHRDSSRLSALGMTPTLGHVILSEPFGCAQDRLRERRIPLMKLLRLENHREFIRLATLRMTPALMSFRASHASEESL